MNAIEQYRLSCGTVQLGVSTERSKALAMIQIKATQLYFPAVLFVLSNESNASTVSRVFSRWFYLLNLLMKSTSVTIQMRATEQYKVVLWF